MPIIVSEQKMISREKYISRIDIMEEEGRINITVRYRWLDGESVMDTKYRIVSIAGADLLELVGIAPRAEVPAGKSFYEAVRDRCYAFFEEKALWPE